MNGKQSNSKKIMQLAKEMKLDINQSDLIRDYLANIIEKSCSNIDAKIIVNRLDEQLKKISKSNISQDEIFVKFISEKNDYDSNVGLLEILSFF